MSQVQKQLSISDNELDALIAEASQNFKLNTLQPEDWTVGRVMEKHQLSERAARRILKQLVADGKAYEIRVRNPSGNGGVVLAYRRSG